VEAVTKTGLATTLSNLVSYTIFAPTNAAFAKATETGGYLVGKTDSQITSILNYHLEKSNRVAASATAFNTSADVTVTTLFPTYTFVITRNSLKIVDKSSPAVNAIATVLNIQGTNGSIQVVDKVMVSL
jgi:uncharacterized surface protein with fasciclin (FAS1) repeats